jgi:Na+/H+-dicarboxylate symporter
MCCRSSFAVLFGAAMARLGARGKPVIDGIDLALQGLFGIVRMVMVFAPIGAFGAIAFMAEAAARQRSGA